MDSGESVWDLGSSGGLGELVFALGSPVPGETGDKQIDQQARCF